MISEQATILTSSLPTTTHDDEDTTASFSVKNHGVTPINIGRTKVAVRNASNLAFDFDSGEEKTLNPGETYNYSSTRKLPKGKYKLWIANYRDGIGWSSSYPNPETSSVKISSALVSRSPVTITASTVPVTSAKNQSIEVDITVKNFSDSVQNIGRIKFAIRNSKNQGYDYASSDEIILNPGEEYTYEETRAFAATGKYTYWIANYRDGIGWSSSYPDSESSSIKKSGSFLIF